MIEASLLTVHGQFAFTFTIAKSLNEFLHFTEILPIQKYNTMSTGPPTKVFYAISNT